MRTDSAASDMVTSKGEEDRLGWMYRYQETQYAPPLNEFDEPVGVGQVSVTLWAYPILRRTPKGVWIARGWLGERFILLGAKKRWACPTVEEAKESFVRRKEAEIQIYEARIYRCQRALKCEFPTKPLIPLSVRDH